MITEQPLNQYGLLEFPMGAEFDGALVGLNGRIFRAAESPFCCHSGCAFAIYDPDTKTAEWLACDQVACMADLREDNKYQTIHEVT